MGGEKAVWEQTLAGSVLVLDSSLCYHLVQTTSLGVKPEREYSKRELLEGSEDFFLVLKLVIL